CSGLDTAAEPSDDTREAWLPGEANATIVMPAPRTSTALLAVRATPRFLVGLGTPMALVRCQNRLPAEVPSAASDVGCLRNQPDPDTTPSPQRNFHNWTKQRPKLSNQASEQDQ